MDLGKFVERYNDLTSLFLQKFDEEAQDKNIVFSPFSIFSLLSILSDATNGATRREVQDLLYGNLPRQGFPEQLKVVGYDDTTFASLCPVPLTTIHQPIREVAHYAVDCLIRCAAGKTVPVSTVFPVYLVERETT